MTKETIRDNRNNVIHVDFATGATHPGLPPEVSELSGRIPSTRDRDPLVGKYSYAEASRVLGISKTQLRAWARTGLIEPALSGDADGMPRYSFQDLIGLRVVRALTDAGVPVRKVREAVQVLRKRLPEVSHPLSELRVTADGTHVVVLPAQDAAYQVTTGQMLFDLELSDLADDVVLKLSKQSSPGSGAIAAAYDAYLEGCKLDEEEHTWPAAEAAYRRAVKLDPTLANAWTNLGNLRYRRTDAAEAQACYRAALRADRDQPEAHYNLGFLLFEEGHLEGAITHFQSAVDQDPAFADAHFNLALALEEASDGLQARRHWAMYLQLDPSGPWADVARAHLLT